MLASADPGDAPEIRMNYYGDPHDLEVMVAVVRKALDVVAHWPDPDALGPLLRAAGACRRARARSRATRRRDELIIDLARHYSRDRLPPDQHMPDRQTSSTPGCG